MIVTEKIYNNLDFTFLEDIMVWPECLYLSEIGSTVYNI